MTTSSQARVERFVDSFIRSDFASGWYDASNDFSRDSDRRDRVYAAAMFGAEGSTHQEIIDDQRHAFRAYIRDRHRWSEPVRFIDAVEEHFDSIEQWHEDNGSLFQEVG